VRYDAPNVVRHGGVSGFSEEFNIIPVGPHRTRVLLRQRFPKGPILSALLKLPGTAAVLQYLVRNWNYQIALEDYSVMQGQAHNIDDFGAPNYRAVCTGDDLIVKFWNWKRKATRTDLGEQVKELPGGYSAEYFSRWDGAKVEPGAVPTAAPREELAYLRPDYAQQYPVAEYPPIHYRHYDEQQSVFNLVSDISAKAPAFGTSTLVGAFSGVAAAAASLPLALATKASTAIVVASDIADAASGVVG